MNLLPPGATSAGEDDRPLYGSFDADGTPTPNRLDPAYAGVAEMRNSSGDRAFSGTAQLQKRLRSGAEVTLAYTYTDARDRVSANCFRINCNLDFEALDGTLNDRRLSASNLESRHKITLGAIANLPLRFRLGLFYNGYSGHPYTYTVSGDVNADGLDVNDAVYLPKNAEDITLADPGQWPASTRSSAASRASTPSAATSCAATAVAEAGQPSSTPRFPDCSPWGAASRSS